MGLFSFLSRKGSARILTSADLAELFSGYDTASGVSVSIGTAMRVSTVWACVRLLAETIAQLPCHVYIRNRDGSKSRVTDAPLADLLDNSPNSWQTIFEYQEFAVTSLAMRGNFFAFVSRGRRGEILELIPLVPTAVSATFDGVSSPKYKVTLSNGGQRDYSSREISHVRGMTLDGFMGISPIGYHRESIGLASAAEGYGSKLFRDGARPSGVIRHPHSLSEEAYARIVKYWNQLNSGKGGRTAILEEGGEYQAISMSNEDAQYLDVRQFQRTEICSIFRIPPHMIGDLTKASFSNITQQSLEFVKYTILPWCRRLETAMERDLLTKEERKKGLFVQYVVAGLERADIKTRYEAFRTGINGGFLSPNEVRKLENLNPRPGGDIYLAPLNMVDSSDGMQQPEKAVVFARRMKGVNTRELLRRQFETKFRVLASVLVRYESGLVRGAVSGQSGQSVQEDLDKIYVELPGYINSLFKNLVREYAVATRKAALLEGGDKDTDIDLADFTEGILSAFALRYAGSSAGQLSKLIRDTVEEELEFVVGQRLDEWGETRPQKVAAREVVQQESAVSRYVWAAAGVTKLQWVRRGSKSCPFCRSLDGKIVGITAPFVEAGNYEPEGHDASPWRIRGPKMHAPIHQGCQCAIVPV